MAWSDEQDAFVRKCWKEGLSAKRTAVKINDELGTSYTRNAIIGRWHRTGCSGLASKWHPKAPAKKATDGRGKLGATVRAANEARKTAALPSQRPTHEIAVPVPETPKPVLKPAPVIRLEEPPLHVDGCTLHQLTQKTCKWPVGDPQDSDFHFCGNPSVDGCPYCSKHASEAYVSATARKRYKPIRISEQGKMLATV